MSARFNPAARSAGFTLLELLVAISVFAIMSIMAYGGLSQIISNNTIASGALDRMQALQHTMYTLTRDFYQIEERNIRDEYGNTQPYLLSNNLDTIIEFTRNGRRNPAGLLRSNLQRVAYQLQDNKLIRLSWPQLDRAPGTEPYRSELLTDVNEFTVRYQDSKAEWHEQWPPLNTAPGAITARPAAIEISLKLKDWGELKRLYRVNR